jgi:hypothetical protein
LSKSEVTILQHGRGGTISYREGDNEVLFEWEFGGSVVALIWGTSRKDWDGCHRWAVGRQPEIYDSVAKEVIRQKAPTSAYEIDLESGTLTVL